MKRKLIFIAGIILCLSLIATGTLAYFSAATTTHNIITSGNVDIQLLEWADVDKTVAFPGEGIFGVMPDTTVTKIAEVRNTGEAQAWVRVRVEKAFTLAGGIHAEINPDLMTVHFDETTWEDAQGNKHPYWQQQGDYYYYTKPLAPDETTAVPLFTSVSFDKTMGNDYQNAKAQVMVTAHAVQTANNPRTAAHGTLAVFEALGWPAK